MALRIVDELKDAASSAVRQASLLSAVVIAVVLAGGFLCAAGFVWVNRTYGPMTACVAFALLFGLVAVVTGTIYAVRRRQAEAHASRRRAQAAHLLADPVVLTTGLQIARSVGLKRLIPVLAIGGVALGLLAARNATRNEAPAE